MARISRIRHSRSFRRKSGNKPPKSITLIVCEGETEQEYFEAARIHFQLTTAEISIAKNTKGSAPISVVEHAEAKCAEQGGYDKIFCVFDRDGHESFGRARERISALAGRSKRPLPIEEAVSVPCFELWVLLHFERTDSPFNRCADVIPRIRAHMAGYVKADAAVARQLMPRLTEARDNASWLEGRAQDNDYNPYTSVHRVIQHFAAIEH